VDICLFSRFLGCIPSDLDAFFNSTDQLELLKATLKKVLKELPKDQQFVTAEELNENHVGGKGHIFYEINRLGFQKTAELMLHLVGGRLKTDEASPLDYI
jgi:hypothetical protein